jgi:hypothetical protein
MSNCPHCGNTFKSERGVKLHQQRSGCGTVCQKDNKTQKSKKVTQPSAEPSAEPSAQSGNVITTTCNRDIVFNELIHNEFFDNVEFAKRVGARFADTQDELFKISMNTYDDAAKRRATEIVNEIGRNLQREIFHKYVTPIIIEKRGPNADVERIADIMLYHVLEDLRHIELCNALMAIAYDVAMEHKDKQKQNIDIKQTAEHT